MEDIFVIITDIKHEIFNLIGSQTVRGKKVISAVGSHA